MCIICSATDFRKINWIQYMMAMVFPNGRVIFIIRSDFQTTCSLNMTSFPFDSQTCYVDMCLQMYPTNNVNLTTGIKSGVCGLVHNTDTFNAMLKGSKDYVMLKQGTNTFWLIAFLIFN